MKKNELRDDILCLALSRYLSVNDFTPYDAVVENSKPHNDAEQWAPLLLSVMTGSGNAFRCDEILNADPVKRPATFYNQFHELHDRTVLVATVAGMLCQHWINHTVEPYKSDTYLCESHELIESTLEKLV